jgi:gluconate kinase
VGGRLASTLGWIFVDADDLHRAENVSLQCPGGRFGL